MLKRLKSLTNKLGPRPPSSRRGPRPPDWCRHPSCNARVEKNGLCGLHFMAWKKTQREHSVVLQSAIAQHGTERKKTYVEDSGYGFSSSSTSAKREMWKFKYRSLVEERTKQWRSVVRPKTDAATLRKEHLKLILLGIPPKDRGDVWFVLSGADRRLTDGAYDLLVEQVNIHRQRSGTFGGPVYASTAPTSASLLPSAGHHASFNSACSQTQTDLEANIKAIEKDVDRTFNDHPFFQSSDGNDALKRVLSAFSLACSDIGYCQSMNFIIAILLLFLDEERAFWMMRAIAERLFPRGYFSGQLKGSRLDVLVLKQLLHQRFPKLATHLTEHQVDISMCCLDWFLNVMVNVVPIECTVRVWDWFFAEGNVVLFRVGLALFSLQQAQLMGLSQTGDLFVHISKMGQAVYDCDVLLQEAQSKACHVSSKEVAKLRKRLAKDVQ